MKKAFVNHKHNGVRLAFPNGNSISTVWGVGTYSDNHDMDWGFKNTLIEEGSDTCEIMIIDCPDKLHKRIHKKYDGDGSIIGYLTMPQWLDIIKMLSKEPKK